ncbi:MAG: anhydro-N-acetylmuramic acid kinase [Pseudomonadota bacterium]
MSARSLAALHAISEKKTRRIIGLMSGTSLDGLDIALCSVTGHGFQTQCTIDQFITTPYTEEFCQRVRSVFAKKDGVSLEEVTLLNAIIGRTHAEYILQALKAWGEDPQAVDLIASHGQTIYHAPAWMHQRENNPHATLQIGDGDHIAALTGIVTISDFRQKHIAGGGEGAPLAAYGDALLLMVDHENRALINIGGIANFTYLPSTSRSEKAFSSDVGPGNTLMDAWAQRCGLPQPYDKDAALGRAGNVHEALLTQALADPFFKAPFPKTTGPEYFTIDKFISLQMKHVPELNEAGIMATLNRLTAETIAAAVGQLPGTPHLYVSGGGAHNPLLLENLAQLLPSYVIDDTSKIGLAPDAKEAALFALLANECVAGDPQVLEKRLQHAPAVSMGKISLPD